jgi:NAD(P)H-hydrate epimerase
MRPPVLSTAESRAVDRQLVARSGLPSLLLMENAGRGIAEIVAGRLALRRGARGGRRVVIVCGPGNNGGDGFVVARHLWLGSQAEFSVEVHLATPADRLSGDAALMFRALTSALPEVRIVDRSRQDDAAAWQTDLASADVVVDALFGTGLRAAVTGIPAIAIEAINAARRQGALVVAADVPSGIDADTGRALGVAVEADVTATVGTHKLGLVLDAAAKVGDVEVVGLGLPVPESDADGDEHAPPSVSSPPCPGRRAPRCYLITERDLRDRLPRRAADAFKGTAGHLVVVAGSAGKTGAAVLVAKAAMRTGAGLVTVATTAAGQAALDAKVIEIMTASYAAGEDADDGSRAAIDLLLERPQVRALALGPGIPVGPHMQSLVRALVSGLALPMVVDADGLNLLGPDAAARLAEASAPRVITPHPGEMGRMLGVHSADVQANRLATARDFAERSRAIVVLKGAHTLIAAPDGTVFVSPIAEPALATAGSGDALTGVIGGLIVQGTDPLVAAELGVLLHGQAGSVAAAVHGTNGVMAGDLPDAVAEVARRWNSWVG